MRNNLSKKNFVLKAEYSIKDIEIQLFKDFESKRWKIKFCRKGEDKNIKELEIPDSFFNKNQKLWKNKRDDKQVIEYLKKFSKDYFKGRDFNSL